MPIPKFQENGLLPPGLHLAEIDEIEKQFGKSTQRRTELFQRLLNFVELTKHCGALRILVDGSFVTVKPEPNDVDVVIWLGTEFLQLLEREDEKAILLEEMFDTREPREAFLVIDEKAWDRWINFFSRIRESLEFRKGLVEIKLK